MWKNKRGISPLIATVLIIGFTVALAAVIMTWGQSFQKDVTKSTEETTERQLICAQDVVVDVSSACVNGETIEVTVKNDGAKDIKRFSARFYIDAGSVETDELFEAAGLAAFDIGTEASVALSPAGTAATVKLVELIPIIDIGGDEHTCSQTIVKFGDATYTDALSACA